MKYAAGNLINTFFKQYLEKLKIREEFGIRE